MSAETIYNLISSIRVSRIKLGKDPIESENKKPWTKEEEKLFYQVHMQLFLADHRIWVRLDTHPNLLPREKSKANQKKTSRYM